jgi:hypothetical protein
MNGRCSARLACRLRARLRHRDLLLKLSASLKVRKSSRRRDRVADPVHVGTDGCPDTLLVAFVGRARAQGSRRARAIPSIYGRGRPRGSRHNTFKRMAIQEQQAQSDALKWIDVTGCDSRKRYRIRHGSAANVHEIDDAGGRIVGWCFVPSGHKLRAPSCLLKKLPWKRTSTPHCRWPTDFQWTLAEPMHTCLAGKLTEVVSVFL